MTTQKKAVPNKRRRSSATADMLDERGAAERLGLSVGLMRKWRLEKSGPQYLKFGGAVRYDLRALDEFIDGARRHPTSQDRLSRPGAKR